MKIALWYWIIGCVVIGLPMGSLVKACPNDDVSSSEIALEVLIWPTIIAALPTAAGAQFPPRKCKVSAP